MKWARQDWTPIPPAPRSPGLHLSQLIREYERDVLGDVARPDDAGVNKSSWFEGGFIFEEMCAALMRRTSRGGLLVMQREIERDGVLMTPDIVDKVGECVIDSKLTWKSTSNIDAIENGTKLPNGKVASWENLWPGYMVQLKAYTHAYGFTKGALVIFFAMGNWKRGPEWSGPIGPQAFVFEWTDEELTRNWEMVLRYRNEWNKRGGPKPYNKGKKREVEFEW